MNVVAHLAGIVSALDELQIPHLVMGMPFAIMASAAKPPITTSTFRLRLDRILLNC